MTSLPNLHIDGARLWGELMETAAIGATPKGGICRLTLTDLDRAVRALVEAGYEPFAPIEVINWTNEEGARFAPAMVSSGVFAGAFDPDWASARRDPVGITFGEALDAIGYRGTQRCGAHPLSAFFELHIEQGPILEAESKSIGIVTGVQGIRWFEATVRGQDAHTGATPMDLRKNA